MVGEYRGKRTHEDQARSIIYRLKLELRRLERAEAGQTPYANALRRVLNSISETDVHGVFEMLEGEIRNLENVEGDREQADNLRHILALIEPVERSRRELFLYYLRKMEQEGRGDEPFAHALRRALESPEGPSLDSLFHAGDNGT